MKRLSDTARWLAGAALATLALSSAGCAIDGASTDQGGQEGVSSNVAAVVSGKPIPHHGQTPPSNDGFGAGANEAISGPHEVTDQGVAPQPQPWRALSDDSNQPQPQPWQPADPTDPNGGKKP